MRRLKLGFPVSRPLENGKPGDRPKPIEDKELRVSQASSGILRVAKPKPALLKCHDLEEQGTALAEDHSDAKEKLRKCPPRINPALKSWLDNVIIPSLVQRYLVDREAPKERQEPTLAIEAGRVYARHDSERKQ